MPFDQTKSVRRNRLLFFHYTLFRKKSFGFLTEKKIRLQVLESVSETCDGVQEYGELRQNNQYVYH